LHSAPLRKVFAAFDAAATEVRVVGGAVRNSLIDRTVKEIDLATPATPDETTQIGKRAGLGVYPTGIDHGTVTLVADGVSFEVTTLRRDVETDGRHAVVAFTHSWLEDAQRRDFTINAFYCDAEGTLYDPIGGLADLRRRRVRFIGDAEARIREDYLRILRFFRFSAEYGRGQLDVEGLAAAVALKQGLTSLAAERVRSEILKLLAAPCAADVVRTMDQCGILQLVLSRQTDPDCHARLAAIEAALGQPPDPIAGLAALAAGDPSTAASLATRLRLSNAEATALERAAIVNPDLDPAAPDAAARVALYRMGIEAFRRAVRVAWARSGAPPSDNDWRRRALLADRWSPPAMPFSGGDILALGIAPGPAVGNVLRAFETWWTGNGFVDDPVLQREVLKKLVQKALA
jgi:poly(A) polymerase